MIRIGRCRRRYVLSVGGYRVHLSAKELAALIKQGMTALRKRRPAPLCRSCHEPGGI